MNNLKNFFDFNISKTYVNPLYPKVGEKINIAFLSKNDVKNVLLNFKKDGDWVSVSLSKVKKINSNLIKLATSISLEEDTIIFFTIEMDDTFLYYSKLGLTAALISDIDCFALKVNFEAPSWVSSSTCYQIYPDRFKNSRKDIGVRDNSYEFDGAFTKERSFDQKPLDFENGRCLDFYNGDLKGIEDSLDYLKGIGVNCLYLNPIGVSKTTHRYDCCDFFHVDPNLGGDEDLISLIDTAHSKGIKVLVDISINHTGIEHHWFKKALEDKTSKEASYYYFEDNGDITYWQGVKTLPQLNFNNQELRDLLYRGKDSVIKKFLKAPFNQDGWRFDVADELGRKDKDQLNDEIWREVRKSIKEEKPSAYILAESWIDSAAHLQGDQWDGTMNYVGCSRPLRRWMGEEDRFTCNDWGHSPRKIREYSPKDLTIALTSQLNSLYPQIAQFQMNLLDSHDTPRLHNNSEVFEFKKYSGAVMLMYTLPGMPSVYYGDEVALDGEMGSVEMSRYPMEWNESKWNQDFVNLYKTLGNLREKYSDVFNLGSFKILNIREDLFILARYNEDKVIFTILNKNESPTNIDLNLEYLLLNECIYTPFATKVERTTVTLNPFENTIVVFNRK